MSITCTATECLLVMASCLALAIADRPVPRVHVGGTLRGAAPTLQGRAPQQAVIHEGLLQRAHGHAHESVCGCCAACIPMDTPQWHLWSWYAERQHATSAAWWQGMHGSTPSMHALLPCMCWLCQFVLCWAKKAPVWMRRKCGCCPGPTSSSHPPPPPNA
jgi:hypothetical protein